MMRTAVFYRLIPIAMLVFVTVGLSSVQARETGDRVLGQWVEGYWYPATIVNVNDTNSKQARYEIVFDDGDEAVVNENKLTDIDWKKGTKVQCNWKGKGRYYPGRITHKRGMAVHIAYDDGDHEDTVIGRCRQQR